MMEEIPCGRNLLLISLILKPMNFTNNYTIDNAQYRVEGKIFKHYQNTNVAEFFGPTTNYQ